MESASFLQTLAFLFRKSWWAWLATGIGVIILMMATGQIFNWDGTGLLFWVSFLSGGTLPLLRVRSSIQSKNFSRVGLAVHFLLGGVLTYVVVLLLLLVIFLAATSDGRTFY